MLDLDPDKIRIRNTAINTHFICSQGQAYVITTYILSDSLFLNKLSVHYPIQFSSWTSVIFNNSFVHYIVPPYAVQSSFPVLNIFYTSYTRRDGAVSVRLANLPGSQVRHFQQSSLGGWPLSIWKVPQERYNWYVMYYIIYQYLFSNSTVSSVCYSADRQGGVKS